MALTSHAAVSWIGRRRCGLSSFHLSNRILLDRYARETEYRAIIQFAVERLVKKDERASMLKSFEQAFPDFPPSW